MKTQFEPLNLIMLVDDDDTTNFVNTRLLTKMGAAKEIVVKKNGAEALEYLQASAKGGVPYPDLIFLDIKMPVMDGFSFLDEYHKQNLSKNGSMIILMLTSSASFYDLERLKDYDSVKKHFSKSLTENDIKDIMQQYYSK
ncbi:response regulator receiver protein [Rufibacter radiotolerans]|uniref:Response regulator receiver protein n=1 Tax=Rufibacter radiotolerans TaxID=1379910 RepID=A0A0H4VSP6_9BACT|nr:response regulator [Rufibacter radiotolerans]AKQ46987.1 response regulator receiver protein [Rufibacter radiotolerans]